MNESDLLLPYVKLQFNIEHPSVEECYSHGYESAMSEVDEEMNPFQMGSRESEHWLEGWWAGFYGEAPLFEIDFDTSTDLATLKEPTAANDHFFHDTLDNFFMKLLEISGVIAVSAIVGYQLIDLVA